MFILTSIIIGILSTLTMTAFSYITSYWKNVPFKEPELLEHMVKRSRLFNYQGSHLPIMGWIIHLLIGIVFSCLLNFVWFFKIIPITIIYAVVIGVFLGIVGIIGWQLMFKVHSSPPYIKFDKLFYLHLLLAHLIFSFTALGIWKIIT